MASSLSNVEGLATASSFKGGRDEIKVFIQFNGNRTYCVDIDVEDTIGDLKEVVAMEANISSGDISLVLEGQLLNDHSVLQDCGLGTNTTLHAFCWSDDGLGSGDLAFKIPHHRDETQPTNKLYKPRTGESSVDLEDVVTEYEHTTDAEGSDVDGATFHLTRKAALDSVESCSQTEQHKEHYRFFVYCKICECVRPAKLRLSCTECGNGAFLVERGPSNWNDISPDTTIRGTCKTHNCICRIPRFYLSCSQSHEGDVEGTAVVLKHVQSNHRRVACITCEDIMTRVLIFPCSPGHVICLECFRRYGSVCLSERRFVEHPQHGYTLPCPAGCTDSHIEESHHFLLLGPEKYEHYKVFGAEEYVLQNGGILCPAPGCGMGLFPDGGGRLIKCQACQYESCRLCKKSYHIGLCDENLDFMCLDLSNLAVNDERAQRACWETRSLSLIEETTKACPGCQTKTERNGGCTHMVCTRSGCGQEWCWICIKPWSRQCQADHWFD